MAMSIFLKKILILNVKKKKSIIKLFLVIQQKKKNKGQAAEVTTPVRPISHPRFKPGGEQHQVRIIEQPTTSMHLDLQKKEESKSATPSSMHRCNFCDFNTTRINVLILHMKNCTFAQKGKIASKPANLASKYQSPVTPTNTGKGKGVKTATPTSVKSKATTPTEKKPANATPKTPKTPKPP